jgi:C4-dicarboxylate-specific signal transduction histidine kinase
MTYDVLFVDDEPENLTVFEAACADRFSVLIASSALQALELLRQHPVSVLIADQRMPFMTGLELLERVRLEFPEIVRMLVTAYTDVKTAMDAINRGQVRRYLSKPWDHDELLTTIAEGIEYCQMRAKLCSLERRLLETERVYSLGVISAGLSRELQAPVDDLRAHVSRARTTLRSVVEAIPADSPLSSRLRGQLMASDEELGEALAGTDRVLDVVRGVETPIGPNKRQNVSASDVLRLTLRLMQSELRAAASVEIDVRPVPLVSGSQAQLGQVMLNLLVHALDTMAATPRHRRALSISLVHQEPWVVFEVGSSVAADSEDFEPRSIEPRASESLPRDLGLAISHSIVAELGGQLFTEPAGNGGTLRRLKLPQSYSATAA